MKKSLKIFLLLLLIFLRKNSEGQSSSIDTLCLSLPVAQKILIAAEQKKILAERIVLLDQNIDLLNQRISGLQAQDSLNEKIKSSYQSEIAVMKEQRAVFELALKENEKTIKRLNRKVRWTAIFGLAGMGTLGFLYLTK